MTSKGHKKHTSIAKPSYGNFARNEWSIIGAPCSAIKNLADTIIKALAPVYKCAYVDTQHQKADNNTIVLPGRLTSGAIAEYTRQIHYHQFNYKQSFNPFQFREFFKDIDLLLINGNHQEAKAQVIVIDSAKSASLKKRIGLLTNVQLILRADDGEEVFDFIKEAIPAWEQLPIYLLNETDKIIHFFEAKLRQARPPLKGLVLAGGKSVRMGRDKGLIKWRDKEQRYYVADILKGFCKETLIACRAEQQAEIDNAYKTLPDTFTDLGPYGAILSAFREQPDSAWLVVACDLPLVDAATLQSLIQHRNMTALATAFESPENGLPEPLIAIWEPKSYPVLLSFLAQGYSCPRKVLCNSEANLLKSANAEALFNVNTPEDAERVQHILRQKKISV